jgi:hypothetical protein
MLLDADPRPLIMRTIGAGFESLPRYAFPLFPTNGGSFALQKTARQQNLPTEERRRLTRLLGEAEGTLQDLTS